jgi:glycosyltransferase involved in cell wall biosynthesis
MQPGEPPVILSAGRLSAQKNFIDLVRTLKIVCRSTPARLVILGEGPEAIRTKLVQEAEGLGLAGEVLLAGFDPNPYRWMSRASVFAISSRWEGASNVALEALACGAPVAAYRCPTGIAEVIEPLGKDYVVPAGDVEALAGAVLRRIEAPRDSRSIVAHAAGFDLTKTLGTYVETFRRALAR